MTVGELITVLSEYDDDLPVYTHDTGSYAEVVEAKSVHLTVGEGGPLNWVRIEA